MGRGLTHTTPKSATFIFGSPLRRKAVTRRIVLPKFGWNRLVSEELLADLLRLPQPQRFNREKILDDLRYYRGIGWETQFRQVSEQDRMPKEKAVDPDSKIQVEILLTHSVYDETGRRIWEEPLKRIGAGSDIAFFVPCLVRASSVSP